MRTGKLGDHVEILSGFAFKSDRFNDEGRGLPLVRIRDVKPARSATYFDGDYDARFVLSDGDLLVGMDGEFNCARWAGGPALLNQRVCRVRSASQQLDEQYLFWFLPKALKNIEEKSNFVTVKHLSIKQINEIEIALPTIDEQKRIAAILDQADELRRKRQRAIDRLNQLGKAIFHEMFGDETERHMLGDFCDVSSGSTPSRNNSSYYTGHIPWVKTGEVNGQRIRETSEHITEEAVRASRLKKYPKGTVLLAMYGQGKTRGQVGILEISATINQACAAIICSNRILPDFLFLQLQTNYNAIRAMGRGGNQPNLNAGMVREIPILVPELNKQKLFLERLQQLEKLGANCKAQHHKIVELFEALQHRALQGEL